MTVYYVIFIILSFIVFTDNLKNNKKGRLCILFIVYILLVLFAGLNTGAPDRGSYIEMYKNILTYSRDGSLDFGFNILYEFFSLFFSNPQIMFICIAALGVGLNLNSFNYYSFNYLFICILLYFVHIYVLKEMIQIRSGLAGALCLFSIRYMEKKQYLKYWVIMFTAISIHLASIIFIIVFFVNKYKISIKQLMVIMGICFIVGIFFPLGQLIKAFPEIDLLSRIQIYSNWEENSKGLGILTNLATVKLLVVSLIAFYFYPIVSKNINYYEILLKTYIMSTCWIMVWNDFAIFGARIATFLSVGEPIIVASFISLFKPSSRFIVVIIYIIIAFFMLKVNMIPSKIVPYKFYF
ncbi:hypothetical protein EZS27_017943 [termite gut metagenome]|uniref:Transmembrane protein EpsG n=1 Tax=termite gut metagenome TaxID=433724 RepID=A0A5J4RID9_9ZZZZ